MEQINEICNKKHIKLVVTIIPEEVQVNQDFKNKLFADYPKDFDQENWDITIPNEGLKENLQRLKIDFIDLTPTFHNHPKSNQLYKPRDTHWNILGNELAAMEIQKFIRKYIDDWKSQ